MFGGIFSLAIPRPLARCLSTMVVEIFIISAISRIFFPSNHFNRNASLHLGGIPAIISSNSFISFFSIGTNPPVSPKLIWYSSSALFLDCQLAYSFSIILCRSVFRHLFFNIVKRKEPIFFSLSNCCLSFHSWQKTSCTKSSASPGSCKMLMAYFLNRGKNKLKSSSKEFNSVPG